MPGSQTTLGRPGACGCAPDVLPSAVDNASASQKYVVFEAQWLAYALPYRRFTPAFTDDGARLGADVVRYSFIAVDLHHLLLAGFTGARPPYAFAIMDTASRSRRMICARFAWNFAHLKHQPVGRVGAHRDRATRGPMWA
jgi:hypothetical protein